MFLVIGIVGICGVDDVVDWFVEIMCEIVIEEGMLFSVVVLKFG